MLKRCLMVIVLGLALTGRGAWAESHVDTHVADKEPSLALILEGLLARVWMFSTQAERDVEEQKYRAQSKVYDAWNGGRYFSEIAMASNEEYRSYVISKAVSYSLTGLDEPILFDQTMNAGEVVVRFTAKSSHFGHYTFRAVAKTDEWFLIAKLSNASEVGPVRIDISRKIPLTKAEFTNLLKHADQVKTVAPRNSGEWVFDGAYWVSEIKSSGAYSVSFYHSPPGGPWQDFAQEIFQHVKGVDEVVIAKAMIGMLLSEDESRRVNKMLR